MRVLFLPEVVQQFLELAEILYDKGYLSFKDKAIEYSESLFDEIHSTLPIKVHRKAPGYFNKYGENMLYASFTKNKHTTWYVFFNEYQRSGETVYLIRYMSNNHVIAHHLEIDN